MLLVKSGGGFYPVRPSCPPGMYTCTIYSFSFFLYHFLLFTFIARVYNQPNPAKPNILINKFWNFFSIVITLSNHCNLFPNFITKLFEEWSINILGVFALRPVKVAVMDWEAME